MAKGFNTFVGRCLESEAIADLEGFFSMGSNLAW
jgi:hypothetical protein